MSQPSPPPYDPTQPFGQPGHDPYQQQGYDPYQQQGHDPYQQQGHDPYQQQPPYPAPDSAPPTQAYPPQPPYQAPNSAPPAAPFPPQPYSPPVSGFPQSPAGYPHSPAGYPPQAGYPAPPMYQPVIVGRLGPPTSGWAVASMVLGIVGLLLVFCAWGIPSLLAVIFGHIGLAETKRGEKSGQGMAVAGLVLGYILIGPAVVVAVLGGISGLSTVL
ncbi:DUF4190 domain-containing protein [Actinoplanes aureus]|uniref:DUF4190 domain-containing protein n=1 Tax=Actinoplanes aureus TaxID=2792083 RepID=A0A931C7W4_9ACTN|nr:DUF4190 domain-containing protein [Actinoplanes aureus]MBG0563012.1 DUF4190 domain-containing protein [Actinoplanes aureus]